MPRELNRAYSRSGVHMVLQQSRQRLLASLRAEFGDGPMVRAMEQVPRELFVPAAAYHLAYEDIPLPIGHGQTISQPFIVALMTTALDLRATDTVLEVGTGSGYQAAILSLLARRVVSVERIAPLAEASRCLLYALGYRNVEVRPAEPVLGCPEEAPFDAIITTAGAPRLPQPLVDQLGWGGRMVVPVGSQYEQELLRVLRTAEGLSIQSLGPCRFVPLVGEGAWPEGGHP